jgi:predicted nucleic acid-binding protein
LKTILDTSVLIASDVQPREGELAISAVTLAELHFGVLDAAIRAERLRRLSDLQRKFDALPVDDDVATSYGELATAVAASGGQPRSRVMDILIAARPPMPTQLACTPETPRTLPGSSTWSRSFLNSGPLP